MCICKSATRITMAATFVCAFMMTPTLFAGGFETKGIGARQLSMGGAAIGLADDWASVYWNPAGLAFLKDSQIASEIHSVFLGQQASESLNNYENPGDANFLNADMVQFTETRGMEPARFNNNEIGATLVTPDIGFYKNFGRFTFASGLYGSSGGGVAWKDELTNFEGDDRILADIDLYFLTMNVPFAAGYQITSNLSVGVNASFIYGYNTRTISKYYVSPDDAGRNNTFFSQSKSRGYGLSVDAGILYKPSSTFSVGALLRAPYTVHATGNSKFDFGSLEESASSVKTHQPLKAGLGVSFTPMQDLKVALDAYYVQHSGLYVDTEYENEGFFLVNGRTEWGFEDTIQYRGGAEYTGIENLDLRLGFFTDPSPFQDAAASLATPRFADCYIGTAGIGYHAATWSFDLSYQYAYAPTRTGNDLEIDSGSQILSFAAVYQF